MKVLKCTDCTRECITLFSKDKPTLCPYNIYDDPVYFETELSNQEIIDWFDSERLSIEWFEKADV